MVPQTFGGQRNPWWSSRAPLSSLLSFLLMSYGPDGRISKVSHGFHTTTESLLTQIGPIHHQGGPRGHTTLGHEHRD